MLNYDEFNGRRSRKFISVQYDNATQHNLRRWAEANNFDLTKTFNGGEQPAESFDFHSTIFYSTSRHIMSNGFVDVPQKRVKVTGFKMLGKDSDVPVLTLDLEALGPIRKYYEEKGLKDEWPVYQAHVSLSYAKQTPSPVPLHLPEFDLTFDTILIKDVIDNPA